MGLHFLFSVSLPGVLSLALLSLLHVLWTPLQWSLPYNRISTQRRLSGAVCTNSTQIRRPWCYIFKRNFLRRTMSNCPTLLFALSHATCTFAVQNHLQDLTKLELMKWSQRKYWRSKLETCSHLQHMLYHTTVGCVCEMKDNYRTISLSSHALLDPKLG